MTDAGTHVPLIANWQGSSPSGTVSDALIDFSDFMPTFAELAMAELPADRLLDGQSFVNQIKGGQEQGRKWVYVQWEGKAWIRNRQWKLYDNGDLFDMHKDSAEKNPLSPELDSETTGKIRKYLRDEMNKLEREEK